MKALPPPLARKHKELLESLAAAEAAMHEQGEKIAAEELSLQALDFLILYVEHVAAHRDNDETGAWQAFLVDLVQQFTIQDEEGVVANILSEHGIEDVILDCCALDDDDKRSIDEKIKSLRDGLLDIRARQDEMSLF